MAKRPLELLTESMFYVLLALLGGEKCGTEISAFIEEKTRGAVPCFAHFVRGGGGAVRCRLVPMRTGGGGILVSNIPEPGWAMLIN